MASDTCRYCGASQDLASGIVCFRDGQRHCERWVLCRDRAACREREQQRINAARDAAIGPVEA